MDFRKYPKSLYRVLIKNIDTVFHLSRIEVYHVTTNSFYKIIPCQQ